ncbi:MAG: PINc/VapC family ATPase [Candidatus Micrarchaeia archaeon]
MRVFVVDTSVIIDGRITELVKNGELRGAKVIVPYAVIAELEHQANMNKEIGFTGIDEINTLLEMAERGEITLEYGGKRPTYQEIRGAKYGEIDAKIREIAAHMNATLISSDRVQCAVAEAEGLEVMYLEPIQTKQELSFKKYFTRDTLSVHLKENVVPKAKIGKPGDVKLVTLSDRKCTAAELRALAKEIVESAERSPNSYIELDRRGATVVQLSEFRIAIAKPPFSDGMEITIVRPIAKMNIEGYTISEKLMRRLSERAEGIVICGSPGAGKSTFTAALAEFYMGRGKIVKTMESPRDLQVSDEITQYSPLEGSFEKTSDILLLARPDYTIYDEMRKTEDFKIFADMRLSGVGMVGVVHATRPIDAIQRFVGRVDMGMIPQIVDTVIHIANGDIAKVYDLNMKIKVPHGMSDEDLARPVIEVKDFETGYIEYELYKFGEEVVVAPIEELKRDGSVQVEAVIRRLVSKFARRDFDVRVEGKKVVLYLHTEDVPRVIGRKGKRIAQMEKKVGFRIDVREL